MLSFLFERDSWYDPKKLRLVIPNFEITFRNIFRSARTSSSSFVRLSVRNS